MATLDNTYMEYSPEFENFEAEQFEWSGEGESEDSEVFSEAELMELAGELLEVNSEAELDQFLGKMIKRAGRSFGSLMRSPLGRTVGGLLKGVAKKALPLAGGAIGGFFGRPLGARIGSGLASAAGGAFGLEAEMMEAEDREFEGAKQFARIAGDAVKIAATAPANANPAKVAQAAIVTAVRRHAPNLSGAAPSFSGTAPNFPATASRPNANAGIPAGRNSGRWVRKGNSIVIMGY